MPARLHRVDRRPPIEFGHQARCWRRTCPDRPAAVPSEPARETVKKTGSSRCIAAPQARNGFRRGGLALAGSSRQRPAAWRSRRRPRRTRSAASRRSFRSLSADHEAEDNRCAIFTFAAPSSSIRRRPRPQQREWLMSGAQGGRRNVLAGAVNRPASSQTYSAKA